MGGFGFNRIATAVLFASFLVLLVSNVVDLLYHPDENPAKGYTVDVESAQDASHTQQDTAPQQDIDLASLMSTADAERGKAVSKKCTACHTFNEGGPDRVGPNLWGIIGSKKCASKDFKYSKALLEKGGHWKEEELFQFLTNPRGYAKGTRMAFAGLSKPQDIADLLAYMKRVKREGS
ncbi:MAG: c-type cytochrome [Anaplasma sp.]